MGKIKKEDLESIVKRDMPGFRVASKGTDKDAIDAAGRRPAADAETPDLQALREKYLSRDRQKYSRPAPDAAPADEPDDDEIVTVEPSDDTDARDRARRSKAVVVSGRTKRIIGKQG